MLQKIQKNSPTVILYQPEIAQNLGTILRLCSCFGVPLNVIEPCGFPFSSRALKRSMMDYGQLTSVVKYINFDNYFEKKEACVSKKRMILLTTKGNQCLWDFDFCLGDHLFFGNEGGGVPDSVAEKANAKVFIPMPGGGRSLNLAVSAGIVLGEVIRQSRIL